MTSQDDAEHFICFEAAPGEMDRYWAEGWRHFGVLFFRYRTAVHGGELYSVLPLRLDISRFVLTRSLKRILRVNSDLSALLRPSSHGQRKTRLVFKTPAPIQGKRP